MLWAWCFVIFMFHVKLIFYFNQVSYMDIAALNSTKSLRKNVLKWAAFALVAWRWYLQFLILR